MDLELAGKRTIVTGGSKDIRPAVAKALSAEGAHVALVARDTASLAAAKAAVEQTDGRVITVSCDTGDDRAVRPMAADVAAAFGGVDILVNAAAQPSTGSVVGIADFDEAEFIEQVSVKVLGYLRCARAVVPSMRADGWGGSSTSPVSRPGRLGDQRHGAERSGRGGDQEPGRRARPSRGQRHSCVPGSR